MATFDVTVYETLTASVQVEAPTAAAAQQIVRDDIANNHRDGLLSNADWAEVLDDGLVIDSQLVPINGTGPARTPTPWPSITIPDSAWNTQDESTDLTTVITIGGQLLHVAAWEVNRESGLQDAPEHPTAFPQLHAAVGAVGPFETTTIHGRNYVLVATPMS